jgi:hypothetical protein
VAAKIGNLKNRDVTLLVLLTAVAHGQQNQAMVAMREVLHLAVWCAVLTGGVYSQVDQSPPGKAAGTIDKDKVADALRKASENTPESIYFVEQLAQAKAVQAIPMLEEKFVSTQDALDRAHIASALVRLGDKDDTYWDFLAKQAALAVESDAPSQAKYDSQGKLVPGPAQEFIAWAKAHNMTTDLALEAAMYRLPGSVLFLAETGDPRGTSLLRRALSSPNFMIQTYAAQGLAQLQDKDSIPLVIDACRRAPAEAATAIADSLVYFDNAAAQSAVDTYIPKDRAKILREARAQGKKLPWSD